MKELQKRNALETVYFLVGVEFPFGKRPVMPDYTDDNLKDKVVDGSDAAPEEFKEAAGNGLRDAAAFLTKTLGSTIVLGYSNVYLVNENGNKMVTNTAMLTEGATLIVADKYKAAAEDGIRYPLKGGSNKVVRDDCLVITLGKETLLVYALLCLDLATKYREIALREGEIDLAVCMANLSPAGRGDILDPAKATINIDNDDRLTGIYQKDSTGGKKTTQPEEKTKASYLSKLFSLFGSLEWGVGKSGQSGGVRKTGGIEDTHAFKDGMTIVELPTFEVKPTTSEAAETLDAMRPKAQEVGIPGNGTQGGKAGNEGKGNVAGKTNGQK
ncbi:hypothetical protein QBC46DRAFT_396779 [Diplogelasinospora grovesii]|uniref:Uncharacterized protein n=1 Tax=Diplogelasinospora grovesii TaxID=303347 RepID=A0AAN6N0S8_9PEZI|nr:hypothetical protein QBC46DRAFT_396779 [Diplogelasinospora grovesii]